MYPILNKALKEIHGKRFPVVSYLNSWAIFLTKEMIVSWQEKCAKKALKNILRTHTLIGSKPNCKKRKRLCVLTAE